MAAGFGIVVKGLGRFRSNIKSQTRATIRNVQDGLMAGAQIILDDALQRVPVRTGKLKRSGRTKRLKREGTVLGAAVIFGGKLGVDYAVTVHEDPAQTDRKYLELAEKSRRREVSSTIAKASKA